MNNTANKNRAYSISNMRFTGVNKYYWKNHLDKFTEKMDSKYESVHFGKDNQEVLFYIAFVDKDGFIPSSIIEFDSKDMMLGYIQGRNEG